MGRGSSIALLSKDSLPAQYHSTVESDSDYGRSALCGCVAFESFASDIQRFGIKDVEVV